jgi:hypothetical protein
MSTFDARPGTRGARQPSGRILLGINGFVARRLRKGGKNPPGFDFDLLLLTTTGRKSGLERTTPLGWVSDGNGGWLIAASREPPPRSRPSSFTAPCARLPGRRSRRPYRASAGTRRRPTGKSRLSA